MDDTESGTTALLHRLGYGYKKPRVVPGKADPEAQRAFLEQYEKLKQGKGADDPIYFMDATHPQHNPVLARGWIKRGEEQEVRTNSGRQRVNQGGQGVSEDLAHQVGVSTPVCPEPQLDRALLEAVQEADALQSLLRNLRRLQSGV